MAGILFVLFALSVGAMGAPIYYGAHPMVQVAGLVIGVVGLLGTAALAGYTAFFQRTSANEAFVRTGRGGPKVVLDSGEYVIPLFHRKVAVSLETMKLQVILDGREHALITKDNLRINVNAEFYIKVRPDRDGILQAARSLGARSVDADNVEALVREKLVSALRHASAQMDLFTIHARRDEFAQIVHEHVRRDLIPNGIDLESVTISALDQLDPKEMSTTNVFDVQGRRKATEITAAQNVETTRLEREAEQAIAQKNVETRQRILELNRMQAESEAAQASEVAQIRAARAREQQEFALEQERAIKEAEIAQQLAVQRREVEKMQAMLQAEQSKETVRISKEQAVSTADVARSQAVEVANREREIILAEKEATRARAEAEALDAQAERERANQGVITVQALAQAEREAGVRLTAAKQSIEQEKIKKQTEVEVAALAELRRADVELETARKQAEARLMLAEAAARSRELEAQGLQAIEMVAVHKAREMVKVHELEVEIERQALENKQTFDRAAIDFEKAKLQIEAQKDVQIAQAKAVGDALAHADFKVYGDPSTMGAMLSNLGKGLGVGALADGLLMGAPPAVREAVAQAGEFIAQAVSHAGFADGPSDATSDATSDSEPRPGSASSEGAEVVIAPTVPTSAVVAVPTAPATLQGTLS